MYPKMVPLRQRFPADEVPDLTGAIRAGLRALRLAERLRPRAPVALGVGSRGVSPLGEVVGAILDELRAAGLAPFVVPAMGSHGGGTAEGQRAVLAGYGISEERLGVPIRSSMATVVVGRTQAGLPVHMDAEAAGADGIVVLGRVKPHTGFHADIESGLCKMLAVGLGKADGARAIHAAGLAEAIPAAARVALDAAPVVAGVALVENAYDRPCRVEVVGPEGFHATDRELLVEARRRFPRVPLDAADLVIVDEMGKNISGTGMDPNVIGMWRRFGGERRPNFGRVAVLGLCPESHGNANGLGLADFTTRRLVDAVDWRETYLNALTALDPAIAKTPVTLETDRACIDTALDVLGRATGRAPTVVRIKNTLELAELCVSEPLVASLPRDGSVEVAGPPEPLRFSAEGRLL
ncbi:MAG TPA: lactate racemase domain-containing protein [Chloroflexota bacterium]